MVGKGKLLKIYVGEKERYHDESAKIEAILPEITGIVPKGLVFTVDIEVHKYGKES